MSGAWAVAESPSGVRHAYRVVLGVALTACGRRVPKARGWFGPIRDLDRYARPVTCEQCLRHTGVDGGH